MKLYNATTLLAAALWLALMPACAHVEGAPRPVVRPEVRHYAHAGPDAEGIRWRGWGDEAFSEARSSGRLIFLDVSASWCHWCMVMEEGTYKDPRVVETLNRDFVPVYVDTDDRPDVNDRYNQGGWPSVAVLTPDGRVLAGRTTLSAEELLALLDTVNQSFREDPDAVYARLDARDAAVEESKKELEKDKKPAPLTADMPLRVLRAVRLFVDPQFGGYGGPDKFPMPEVLQFALYTYPKVKAFKEESPEEALELTLDGMAAGLSDPVEGGFFRYSTSVDWKSPHYEKLLSLNGDLLGIYMSAYRIMGDKDRLRTAESIAGYMLGALYDDASGAFHASQAADEQYYLLDYAGRKARGAPPVDGAVYADANARAALGFLEAYRATGDERYMAAALRVVEYIAARMYVNGEGVRHSADFGEGYLLSDQVYSALAAVGAYQATGNRRYLEFAMDVAGFMAGKFWDPEEGGFFDTYYSSGPAVLVAGRDKPQIENSKAAMLLMDLYRITGLSEYRETASRALLPYTSDYSKYSFWAAPFAHAVERVIEPAYQFIVLGSVFEDGTMDLVKKAFRYDDPDRVVVVLDPEKDADRIAKLGYAYQGAPVLYVCSEKACFPPVRPGESLDKVRQYIEKAKGQ